MSKRGLYYIKDNFMDFWFKFIYPNRSAIETGNTEQVSSKIRAGFVERHVSFVYENVCRQQLWEIVADGKLPFRFTRVGRWWNGQYEIDIVALDSAGTDIVFGECKYTGGPMDADVFFKLQEKKNAVNWKKELRNEYFVFFCISGYTEQMKALAAERANVLLY